MPLADWLARQDVGSAGGPLHETAVDNARGRLLTLGAGLVAVAALVFTALNFSLLRRNSEQADQWQRRTHELTEQGQVTDRYTKAIEQLCSDKLDVRIGGIYALERIARDSARDHPAVMEVLAAFIREHSREPWPLPGPDGALPKRFPEISDGELPDSAEPDRWPRPDVQAALTVVGRRVAERDARPIDLSRADLAGADLAAANLRGANLDGADLARGWLTSADLAGAVLLYAKLNSAMLSCADLTKASLGGADLTGAFFNDADLAGANLRNTHLAYGSLISAHLAGADLGGADLTWAQLSGADLTGARLTRADFTNAKLSAVTSRRSSTARTWKPRT